MPSRLAVDPQLEAAEYGPSVIIGAAIRNERQESWFAGVEGAFRHFGGVTKEVLLDNDRGLVARTTG